MKKLIYKIEGYTLVYNPKTCDVEQQLSPAEVVVYNPTDAEIVKAAEIAYNGEYTIEDDGVEEVILEPSQLDRIESQVVYTAMMTDTLLE